MDKRQERREKVIKGLECCNNDECDSCPYYRSCDENDLGTCKATLHRDALALLKAQEPDEDWISRKRLRDEIQYYIDEAGWATRSIRCLDGAWSSLIIKRR